MRVRTWGIRVGMSQDGNGGNQCGNVGNGARMHEMQRIRVGTWEIRV